MGWAAVFNVEDKIEDSRTDEDGLLMEKIWSFPTRWSGDQELLRQQLIKSLESKNYIGFAGHPNRYHLSVVGESCLYQIPTNRRGNLSVFRGKLVRIVCVHSGSYANRYYMAGLAPKI